MNILMHEQSFHDNRLGLSKAGRKQLIGGTLIVLLDPLLVGGFFLFWLLPIVINLLNSFNEILKDNFAERVAVGNRANEG